MQRKMQIYFYSIKICEHTLKFSDTVINKKGLYAFKQAIALDLVDIDKIVRYHKFKHRDKGF